MKNKEEFKKTFHSKMDEIKKGAAELDQNLNATKEKAVDEFEELKENFKIKLDEGKEKLTDLKDISEEKKVQIKTKFEELQLQLALGKAESKDKIKEQKEKISKAVHELDQTIDDRKEDFEEFVDGAYADFSTHIDTLDEKWDKAVQGFKIQKANIEVEIDEFKDKMGEWQASAGEKWNDVEDEISEKFNQLRGFFSRKDNDNDKDSDSEE